MPKQKLKRTADGEPPKCGGRRRRTSVLTKAGQRRARRGKCETDSVTIDNTRDKKNGVRRSRSRASTSKAKLGTDSRAMNMDSGMRRRTRASTRCKKQGLFSSFVLCGQFFPLRKVVRVSSSMTSTTMIHVKAREPIYPNSTVKRLWVPDDKVHWSVSWPEYDPVSYTAPHVKAAPVWADPDIRTKDTPTLKFNSVDGKVNRRSYTGNYQCVEGIPRNPQGRTGMMDRGLLGKWGPNHAADPIVTRWKRDASGKQVLHPTSGKPILQFIAIMRKDSGEWAIPGGMVDAGEKVSQTLKREFGEEAMNSLEVPANERKSTEKAVGNLFKRGIEVYRGYVDDPRNTDNAWMETMAVNFHDDQGTSVGKFKLHAGDDAAAVQWHDVGSDIKLYASHASFIELVVNRLGAHW